MKLHKNLAAFLMSLSMTLCALAFGAFAMAKDRALDFEGGLVYDPTIAVRLVQDDKENKYFSNISDAVAAVENGQAATVEVLKDFTQNSKITVGGGKNITIVAERESKNILTTAGSSLFNIENGSQLTLGAPEKEHYINFDAQLADIVEGNGGFFYNNGNLTINNCAFSNSTVTGNGGVVYNFGGTLTVSNSIFENNSAGLSGGVIYSDSSGANVNVFGGYFANNLAVGQTSSSFIYNNGAFFLDGPLNFNQAATDANIHLKGASFVDVGQNFALYGAGIVKTTVEQQFLGKVIAQTQANNIEIKDNFTVSNLEPDRILTTTNQHATGQELKIGARITLHLNHGTGQSGNGWALSGQVLTKEFASSPAEALPTNPTRTGYTFAGWFEGQEQFSTNTLISKNKAYTAVWQANQYTLAFDANGGSVSPESKVVTYDQQIGALPVPTKTGHEFGGWLLDGKIINNQTVWLSATNKTATAVWQAKSYVLSFDSAGGSEVSDKIVVYNLQIGTLTTPVKTGYTFDGWTIEGTSITAQTIWKHTENKTALANWVANVYTVNYNSNKPTNASSNIAGLTPASTHTYDLAKNLNQNGYTLQGWAFANWNTKADGSGTIYADKAQVINLTSVNNATFTLYAQWTANTYTVIFNKNAADATGTMSAQTFVYDTAQNLKANAFLRTGHTFAGWNTQANGSGASFANSQLVTNLTSINNSTVTLQAQWNINFYTLTIKYHTRSSSHTTNLNITAPSGTVLGGSDLTLNNTATVTAPYSTSAVNVTISKTSAHNYYLGINSAPTINSSVNSVGFNFTPTSHKTIDVYVYQRYTITFNINGATEGTAPSPHHKIHGTDTNFGGIILNFWKRGHTFTGWNTAANGSGDNYILGASYSDNISRTLYANWALNPIEITTNIPNQTYTGSEIKPAITVKDTVTGLTLTQAVDYTLSFSNNVNVGTATVTVTGVGDYLGRTASKNFNIVTKGVTISWSSLHVAYTGSPQSPNATIVGVVSGDSVSALISGAPQTNVGSYAVSASLTGASAYNYHISSGENATFVISAKPLPVPSGIDWDISTQGSAIALWNAVPNATNYTVVLHNSTGGVVSTATTSATSYNFGSIFTSAARAGHYFVVRANGSGNFATSENSANSSAISSYTVVFNTSGGSAVANQYVIVGQKATRPATNPTKSGLVFDEWYSSTTYTTVYNFSAAINSGRTIYANWTLFSFNYLAGNSYEVTGFATGLNPIPTNLTGSNSIPTSYRGGAVISIAMWAFEYTGLTSLTIPSSITSIAEGAFYGNQITSVSIPNSVEYIGEFAFYQNNFTSGVSIGSGLSTIAAYAFAESRMSSLTISNGVKVIKEGAFDGNFLEYVGLPNSVTTIESYAFSYNSISSITIPSSVTSIKQSAFNQNPLTSVSLLGASTQLHLANTTSYNELGTNSSLQISVPRGSYSSYYNDSTWYQYRSKLVKPNTTITFDKQGGSGGYNSVVATYGNAMPYATSPTRTNYSFMGYYTSTNGYGTQYYTSSMASARVWGSENSSYTLYAYWVANTYTVNSNSSLVTAFNNIASSPLYSLSINVTSSFTQSTTVTVPSGKSVTINAYNASRTITRSTSFSGNMFVVNNSASQLTFGNQHYELTISGNNVQTSGSSTNGKGVYITSGTVFVDSLANFKQHINTDYGSAFRLNGSSAYLYIYGGNHTYNETTNTNSQGGMIDNSNGNVYIYGGSFAYNKAGSWGGGVVFNGTGGNVVISNGTFSGNSAGRGGVVANRTNSSTLTISGGTYSANSSDYGRIFENYSTGTVNLSGTIKFSSSIFQPDIYLNSTSGYLTITGYVYPQTTSGSSNKLKIGLSSGFSAGSNVAYSSYSSYLYVSDFSLQDTSYSIYKTGSYLRLQAAGGGSSPKWRYSSLTLAPGSSVTNYVEGGSGTITLDFSYDPMITYTINQNTGAVTFTANRYVFTGGYTATFYRGGQSGSFTLNIS